MLEKFGSMWEKLTNNKTKEKSLNSERELLAMKWDKKKEHSVFGSVYTDPKYLLKNWRINCGIPESLIQEIIEYKKFIKEELINKPFDEKTGILAHAPTETIQKIFQYIIHDNPNEKPDEREFREKANVMYPAMKVTESYYSFRHYKEIYGSQNKKQGLEKIKENLFLNQNKKILPVLFFLSTSNDIKFFNHLVNEQTNLGLTREEICELMKKGILWRLQNRMYQHDVDLLINVLQGQKEFGIDNDYFTGKVKTVILEKLEEYKNGATINTPEVFLKIIANLNQFGLTYKEFDVERIKNDCLEKIKSYIVASNPSYAYESIVKNKGNLFNDEEIKESSAKGLEILLQAHTISEIIGFINFNNRDKLGITNEILKSEEIQKVIDTRAVEELSKGNFNDTEELIKFFQIQPNQEKELYLRGISKLIVRKRQVSPILENFQRIPSYLYQELENQFFLLSYQKELNVIDDSIYFKYRKLKELPSQEPLKKFITEINGYIKKINHPTSPEDEEMKKFRNESPYYLGCLNHVYPKGNHSSHERNQEYCKENPLHTKTDFKTKDLGDDGNNQTGYLLRLSGVLGYEYQATDEESKTSEHQKTLDIISDYSQRIERIHNFVRRSGANIEKLQQDFAVLIDKFSKDVSFVPEDILPKLSVHEKVLTVLLQSLINFKTKKPVEPIESIRVQDLLIIYRYAYLEDMNAYVQMTRDNIERQKDELSKEFLLLSQLNVIYGENYKHILNNELVEVLKDSVNKVKIQELFQQQFNRQEKLSKEEEKFKLKFVKSLTNSIINNPSLTEEQKPEKIAKELLKKFKYLGDNDKQDKWERILENENKTSDELLKLINEKDPSKLFDHLNSLKRKFLSQNENENQRDDNLTNLISNTFSRDYNLISQELAKYQPILEEASKETRKGEVEIKKSAKERKVRGFFSPLTPETFNARMSAFLCLAGNNEMGQNPNYMEFVLYDEEAKRCSGLTMLLEIEDYVKDDKSKEKKKYLWIGPNPSEDLLSKVSYQECYDQILNYIKEFARINKYDGIVTTEAEKIHGSCTNRDSNFVEIIKKSILKENDNYKRITFQSPHQLAENYDYQECCVIWENEKIIDESQKK